MAIISHPTQVHHENRSNYTSKVATYTKSLHVLPIPESQPTSVNHHHDPEDESATHGHTTAETSPSQRNVTMEVAPSTDTPMPNKVASHPTNKAQLWHNILGHVNYHTHSQQFTVAPRTITWHDARPCAEREARAFGVLTAASSAHALWYYIPAGACLGPYSTLTLLTCATISPISLYFKSYALTPI